jgi:hypothetical protein
MEDKLKRVVEGPVSSRRSARFTDVSDETQVEGAMRAAHAAFDSLDIVVLRLLYIRGAVQLDFGKGRRANL